MLCLQDAYAAAVHNWEDISLTKDEVHTLRRYLTHTMSDIMARAATPSPSIDSSQSQSVGADDDDVDAGELFFKLAKRLSTGVHLLHALTYKPLCVWACSPGGDFPVFPSKQADQNMHAENSGNAAASGQRDKFMSFRYLLNTVNNLLGNVEEQDVRFRHGLAETVSLKVCIWQHLLEASAFHKFLDISVHVPQSVNMTMCCGALRVLQSSARSFSCV